ncbi:UDP-2,4-diacetamido-2,4,6-trideoxy-beta-L-altropyranose hydrolase [Sulfurimonas sp.]|jgi:UDP-2,4-diacetamido-2,4,6-trideoxy-beta-L-altropyranose hydrolase|uniref:UDP-2,4-diacetamido-2,4, 6-trideoxy-beta-L-altropyranose hydrolase n=1 Tax=Sulfurimonas sp. TaxID=2022749 RepID=UPI0025F497BC|nr:UDP-2,4-diacetamido-2,4,6-trideoxy-beta-L-altropyranose hydrolase [Sulfurimonas sp.]MBT5935837.1 UDP-2,4-diacetamido-2,4,6-trideoxy-beta-L-altropyranose hydrolase [Sulfurimonas sp.]
MSEIKNILFRADSSSTLGTGHIMRDLVLASQYQNATITFAVQNLVGNINYKILEAGYKIKILKSNDIKELHKLIVKLNIDMIVIDHYGINYSYEKNLKLKNSSLKIFSLDDTYKKHYCDILLNHNISGDKKRYNGLVPKYCEVRAGSKYTLLRDEFIKEKKKLYKQNKKKTIFLSIGGSDHSNINIKILEVLQKFKNLKVNLLTTYANANLQRLKNYTKNKKNIKLHVNSSSVARLMRKSDFGIITPSVTANEAYFLQLPFMLVKTADNQEDLYTFLKLKHYATIKKINYKKLTRLLKKTLKQL